MFQNTLVADPDTTGQFWDTSGVTNMARMFAGAVSARPGTQLWQTTKVTDMSSMFRGAVKAEPDVSKWDTSKVVDMGYMFAGAVSASPETRAWKTGSVTRMEHMFQNATVANPDTGDWNTTSVTTMAYMFSNASSADPNVTLWNTERVLNMKNMFRCAVRADPDTSRWDVREVLFFDNFDFSTKAWLNMIGGRPVACSQGAAPEDVVEAQWSEHKVLFFFAGYCSNFGAPTVDSASFLAKNFSVPTPRWAAHLHLGSRTDHQDDYHVWSFVCVSRSLSPRQHRPTGFFHPSRNY